LVAEGAGIDDIAARFGAMPAVVKQRLKLAAVSAKLLDHYRAGEMSLEQVMAFAITDDHVRQEEVWASLTWNKEADTIRRALTSAHVHARDKRAIFVGLAAYEAAGGVMLRDLFAEDQGGYLQDVSLLDRLVREKLDAAADAVRSEGWKWVEVHPDYPYGHAAGMRRVYPRPVPLPAEEQARRDTLEAEYDALVEAYRSEEAPDHIVAQLEAIAQQCEPLEAAEAYDAADIARGGATISVAHDGSLRVERGFVRPEDSVDQGGSAETVSDASAEADDNGERETHGEDEGLGPLPERLVADLTAHRTMALQDCLAARPLASISMLSSKPCALSARRSAWRSSGA
jgi:ParB family chromosome partitioning protein